MYIYQCRIQETEETKEEPMLLQIEFTVADIIFFPSNRTYCKTNWAFNIEFRLCYFYSVVGSLFEGVGEPSGSDNIRRVANCSGGENLTLRIV
jgi:hypothetical protein